MYKQVPGGVRTDRQGDRRKGKQPKKHKAEMAPGHFPGGPVVKNLPAMLEMWGSILGSGRSPGGEMATHSSILAWIILWTEEPGGLQAMESQRVRHN